MENGNELESRSFMKKILSIKVIDCQGCQRVDASTPVGIHNSEQMRTMNIFRSRFHNIFTETVSKVALSADDDKRVVMEDKISTLAIGHYRAEKYDIANMRFDD